MPEITYSGLPRAGSPDQFQIIGHNVVVLPGGGSTGALMYGVQGRASTPFHNGKLCVQSNINIRGITAQGGQPGSCGNTFVRSLEFLFDQMNMDQIAHFIGLIINAQYLYDDDPESPDMYHDALTQGLEFVVIP